MKREKDGTISFSDGLDLAAYNGKSMCTTSKTQ